MTDSQPINSYKELIATNQHHCITTATMELRFRTNSIIQMMDGWLGSQPKTLEQAHQCIQCGKIEWREVPTICEEVAK
jgi:hypothetical protein